MLELKIDQEFKNKIPSLSDDEFKQLEENILSDGEIREPIIVWNGTIVDGHNRWAIYLKHKDTLPEPKTREIEFSDKWEAFVWMFKNQLGRRNLTDEQRAYLVGKQYEAEKHTRGGQEGNTNAKRTDPKDPFVSATTAEKVGEQYGICEAVVKRDAMFAQTVDRADELIPGFKDKVLSGNAHTSKYEVRHLKNMDDESLAEKAKEIIERQERPKHSANPELKEIKRLISEAAEATETEFTGMDVIREIASSLQIAKESIEYSFRTHKELAKGYVLDQVEVELKKFNDKVKEIINENR